MLKNEMFKFLREINDLITNKCAYLKVALITLLVSSMEYLSFAIIPVLLSDSTKQDPQLTEAPDAITFLSFLNKIPGDFIPYILVAVFLSKAIVGVYCTNKVTKYIQFEQASIRARIYQKITSLNIADFYRYKQSDLINVIQHFTGFYHSALSSLLELIGGLLINIAILVVVIQIDSNIIYISFFMLFAILAIDQLTRGIYVSTNRVINESNEAFIRNIGDAYDGFREIKIYEANDFFRKRFFSSVFKIAELRAHLLFVKSIPKYFLEFVTGAGLIWATIYVVGRNTESINNITSTIVVIALAAARLLPFTLRISSLIAEIRSSIPAIHEISLIMNKHKATNEDTVRERSVAIPFESLYVKDIVCELGTGKKKQLMKFLGCFEISKGETIAIIGQSGVGKSTFLDLIVGFKTAVTGDLTLNSSPLVSPLFTICNISFLPQAPFLLNGSVEENISFSDNLTPGNIERVNSVLEKVSLTELITNSADSSQGRLSGGARSISGGQGQRIGVARSMYFESDLIILDEPNAALDEGTNEKVISNIRKFQKERNTALIIVTHNLEKMGEFDRVYEIKKDLVIQVK